MAKRKKKITTENSINEKTYMLLMIAMFDMQISFIKTSHNCSALEAAYLLRKVYDSIIEDYENQPCEVERKMNDKK